MLSGGRMALLIYLFTGPCTNIGKYEVLKEILVLFEYYLFIYGYWKSILIDIPISRGVNLRYIQRGCPFVSLYEIPRSKVYNLL
jgi:hypothetical protein